MIFEVFDHLCGALEIVMRSQPLYFLVERSRKPCRILDLRRADGKRLRHESSVVYIKIVRHTAGLCPAG
jgi:hypothetical protein